MSETADLLVIARPECLAIRDGRIVALEAEADVRRQITTAREVLDARDAVVVPGLTDGHSHPVMGTVMSLGVDLSGLATLDQVRRALAGATPDRHGWVRGFGLDHNVFSPGPVTNEVLDEVLPGLPVVVRLYDAHSVLASREAVRRAGITGREELPWPARVAVDDTGEPTGHLVEMAAIELVEQVQPQPTQAELVAAFRAVTAGMAARGLTGGHVMDDLPGTAETLAAVDDDATALRWRVHGWLHPEQGADRVEELARRALSQAAGRRWRHAGVKLFLDGTVEGGTAWLEQGDTRGESVSSTWPDPETYRAVVHGLDARGVRTATHAIGDAAVDHAVSVLAGTTSPARHRIEHLETVRPETLAALAAAGIIASMQPTHCTRCTRADAGDEWSQRVGAARVAQGWPVGELRRRGVTVALGSDWPVAAYDPWVIMADAQLRRPVDQPDDGPRQDGQQVTAQQALEGYTSHAARAIGEDDAGRLAVGALADLTVVEADPLRATPEELAGMRVVATLVDGVVVHHG